MIKTQYLGFQLTELYFKPQAFKEPWKAIYVKEPWDIVVARGQSPERAVAAAQKEVKKCYKNSQT